MEKDHVTIASPYKYSSKYGQFTDTLPALGCSMIRKVQLRFMVVHMVEILIFTIILEHRLVAVRTNYLASGGEVCSTLNTLLTTRSEQRKCGKMGSRITL